jgi:hypothetical protein
VGLGVWGLDATQKLQLSFPLGGIHEASNSPMLHLTRWEAQDLMDRAHPASWSVLPSETYVSES